MKLRLVWLLTLFCLLGCKKNRDTFQSVSTIDGSPILDFNLAENLSKLGRYDSATFLFNKARQGYQKMNENAQVIECYNRIGANYISLRKYDSSFVNLSAAILLGRKSGLLGTKQIATTYDNLGVYFGHLDQLDSSKLYLIKGLNLRTKIFGSESYEVALSLSGLGWIFSAKKDYDSALYYLKKSLAVGQRVVSSHDPLLTNCYLNLAYNYAGRGDYDRGLLYMNEAHKIWDQDSLQNHPALHHIYLNIGNYYSGLEKYGEALEWFNKILSKPLTDDIAVYHAHAYLNRADCRQKTRKEGVIEDYLKGLKILQRIYGGNGGAIASVYMALARVYGEKAVYDSAYHYVHMGQQNYTRTFGQKSVHLANALVAEARLLYVNNELRKALLIIQQALPMLTNGFEPKNILGQPRLSQVIIGKEIIDLFSLKGELLASLSRLDGFGTGALVSSLNSYLLAIEVINRIKGDYTFDRSKLLLGKDQESVYQGAMNTAMKLHELNPKDGYDHRAFELAERNRANVLLSNFQDSRARQFSRIPPAVLQLEKQLKIDLEYVKSKMKENLDNDSDVGGSTIRKHEFFRIKVKYDSLINYLKIKFPKYHQLSRQARIVSVSELQQKLKPSDALIEYFVDSDSIRIFLVTKNKFSIASVSNKPNVSVVAQEVLKSINKFDKGLFRKNSSHLFRILIAPIESLLHGVDKLIIVPHNDLALVPFDCLIKNERGAENDLRYLIEDFEVVQHYSATLFGQDFNASVKAKGLVAFAPIENFQYVKEGPVLADLPSTQIEVTAIHKLAKETSPPSVKYLSAGATKANFKNEIGNFRYVHLATHTVIDKLSPEKSAIYFSTVKTNSSVSEGIMEMSETYNLTLNAELVVLSSCETAVGEVINGEGVLTMTRGFYYSGARNILCTLWKVNDELTKDFMIRFYKEVLDNDMPISKALRNTKIKFLESSSTAFPKHWSGFTLIGN